MGKFMQWMRNELEGIKAADIGPPDYEVDDGEEVIGTLVDTDLQKLSVLRDRLNGQVLALAKEHAHKAIDLVNGESRPDHDPAICDLCAMIRGHAILSDKKDAIDALFWTGLRHELSDEALVQLHKAGGTVGLRKDWKIVACRESKSSPLAALLALGIPI